MDTTTTTLDDQDYCPCGCSDDDQVEYWHIEDGKASALTSLSFKDACMEVFDLSAGTDDLAGWRIRFLLTGATLTGDEVAKTHPEWIAA